ncbi:MAG: hypothetical protein V3R64_02035 [Sphingomonadales bacterium]
MIALIRKCSIINQGNGFENSFTGSLLKNFIHICLGIFVFSTLFTGSANAGAKEFLLGFNANLALAEENTEENVEGEKCLDHLGVVYAVTNVDKRSDITQEWMESLNICAHRTNAPAPETLETNFGLTEISSAKDYKKVAKVLKNAATARSGYSQIYVPGFNNVSGFTMPVKTSASSTGDPVAQYLLGYIYANGLTGKVKTEKAKRNLERAAAQGHPQARELLDEIENNSD